MRIQPGMRNMNQIPIMNSIQLDKAAKLVDTALQQDMENMHPHLQVNMFQQHNL